MVKARDWSQARTGRKNCSCRCTAIGQRSAADLEFDDDVAQLLDVEGQEVDHELFALHCEGHLPSDEAEAGTEFAERVLDPVDQRLFQFLLGVARLDSEEVEDVGILDELLGLVRRTRSKASRDNPRGLRRSQLANGARFRSG